VTGTNGDPYSSITGWGVIRELREPGSHTYGMDDAVEVVFDFTPDEPDARRGYRFPEVDDHDQRVTVGAGANPSRQWAHHHGLMPGTRHRCRRRELRRGVGPPVLFEFPDLDFDN
jgi:hypothetical protein